MDNSLAPVLANIFMGIHERKWIHEYKTTLPLMYRRSVDDIFAIFNSKAEALIIFDYINSRHQNIKFTMETEVDSIISFLDFLISNNSDFKTSVFTNQLILVYYLIITV